MYYWPMIDASLYRTDMLRFLSVHICEGCVDLVFDKQGREKGGRTHITGSDSIATQAVVITC